MAGGSGRCAKESFMAGRFLMLPLVFALSATTFAADDHVKEVEQWRAKHEADYTREYVPLAGLFFLKSGANTAGSGSGNAVVLPSRAPASIGRFVYTDQKVTFEPDASAGVMLKGTRVSAAIELKPDDPGPGDELTIGNIAFWVHVSGDRRAIRVRDPEGTPATSFAGYKWFPIADRYRVTGKFVKDPAPRKIQTPNLLGDLETYTTEGVVEFTLEGQKVRLRPMTTRPGRLYFIFRDATSGRETYDAARFLYSDLKIDGTTVLDFNEAYNPPCAFNSFTTCPLPLPENRLVVRILAGERAYARSH
jgi:uncharacterized protein (DUF1684 family)